MASKIFIIGLIIIVGFCVYFFGFGDRATENQTNTQISNNSTKMAELKKEILQEGTGEPTKAGQEITVHYTGTLENGTKFDSSLDRGTPFAFTLGAGSVIKGWDQGLLGSKVGEKLRLTIPSDLGYGSRDLGSIPPNSTLIFEIEVLKIE